MLQNSYKYDKDKLSGFIRLICFKEIVFLAGNWLVSSFLHGHASECIEPYIDSRFLVGSLLMGIDAAVTKSVSNILLELETDNAELLHGSSGAEKQL